MSTKKSSKAKKAKAKKGIQPENGSAVDQTQVATPIDDATEAAQINEPTSIETPAPRRPRRRCRPRQ